MTNHDIIQQNAGNLAMVIGQSDKYIYIYIYVYIIYPGVHAEFKNKCFSSAGMRHIGYDWSAQLQAVSSAGLQTVSWATTVLMTCQSSLAATCQSTHMQLELSAHPQAVCWSVLCVTI